MIHLNIFFIISAVKLNESLSGGDKFYLLKGVVCDEYNSGISSQLDEALLKFETSAFLQVIHTPYTKKGKLPKANF